MTGGGAATNAGIDFQQRIGALAMTSMLVREVDLGTWGLGSSGSRAGEIHFESNDDVDDLVISSQNHRVYIQAKNTLSASASDTSELAKVIRQFVSQFLRGSTSDDQYVLAVSESASGRIRKDLRKLTFAARLNESNSTSNPLTKDEQEVLDIVNGHIDRAFQAFAGRHPREEERKRLWRQMSVQVYGVAAGGSDERSAITALAAQHGLDAVNLWMRLIALALTMARNRLSLDEAGLRVELGLNADVVEASPDNEERRLSIVGNLPMGREVLLVEDPSGKYVLMDIKRFADDGTQRAKFEDGTVTLAGGDVRKVIARTATYERMQVELLSGGLIPEGSELVVFPSTYEEDLNAGAAATRRRQECEQRLRQTTQSFACVQCGRAVSEDGAPLVEVDEVGEPFNVGMVHESCRRPMHRVFGRIGSEFFASQALSDFDYPTFVKQLHSGQGAYGPTLAVPGKRVILAWNPEGSEEPTGSFAVAYDLADGSTRYVSARGKVTLLAESAASELSEQFNESLRAQARAGDPYCSDEGAFGPYTQLVAAGNPAPLRVVRFYVREVSQSTALAHRTVENYWTPVFHLVDATSGEPFRIGEAVPLLSDPLRFGSILENWRAAGVAPDSIRTRLLADDSQFDLFMFKLVSSSLTAVLDPTYSLDGELIGGTPITALALITGPPPA